MGKASVFKIPDIAKRLTEKLTDMACEANFVERPADEPLFAESYLLDDFDAFRAVQLLADDRPSFYGHKEAVYAAFCGWIIDSTSDGLIYDLVSDTVWRLLGEAEDLAGELPFGTMIEQDIFARYFIAGPQFIEHLYNGIGGIAGTSASSREEVYDAINSDHRAKVSVLQFMRYCHYWASTPNLNIKPSVRRGINAVKQEVDTDNFWASESSIYDVWSVMKHTIALSYAASTIVVADGVLSDQWDDGSFDYREQCGFIPLLLGRARYVCDHVLLKMHEPTLYKINAEPLREINPLEFDVFPFEPEELAAATDRDVNKKRLIQKAKATRARLNRDVR